MSADLVARLRTAEQTMVQVRFSHDEEHVPNLLGEAADRIATLEDQLATVRADTVGALHRGGFSCTIEHAVEQAYVMSCAEVSAFHEGGSAWETGSILADYVRGDITADEAANALLEDLPDVAFPAPPAPRDGGE